MQNYSFNMAVLAILILSTLPSLILSLTIKSFVQLPLPPNVESPESLAFNIFGEGPFTGVSDGRVLKYSRLTKAFDNYSYTSANRTKEFCDGIDDLSKSPVCGLPLGLGFNYLTGQLYACDPFQGLTVVGPLGGLATAVVPTTNGIPYKFLIAVDVANDGFNYFTDASLLYGPKDVDKSIQTGDSTARVLKYDPKTKNVAVVLTGLAGAVGLATDTEATSLLVSEFIAKKNSKVLAQRGKTGTSEILLTLPGNPNKIKRNLEGNFWVSVNDLNNDSTYSPMGYKINSNGEVLATVDLGREYNTRITIVQEQAGQLYVGGRGLTFVGRYDIVY